MNGFISYAHADRKLLDEFLVHLSAVERAQDIDFWSDVRLTGGKRWGPEIQGRIDTADAVVLLLSPAFFASKYIWEHELPAIQARRNTPNRPLVLPVVLKPCFWSMFHADRQAVPVDAKGRPQPISTYKPRDHGHDKAREAISASIEDHFKAPPKTVEV